MEERALELLTQPDHVLFRAGGCHVFALALRDASGLPLLWLREVGGGYDHIACAPAAGHVLDFFGWFSYSEYMHEEMLGGRTIRFDPINDDEVRRRFIFTKGQGYYAHSEFFVPAPERARAWIEEHRDYFDGNKKKAIPGVCRVTKANDEGLATINKERG